MNKRLLAVGFGRNGAVLEIPAQTSAEALSRAYEEVSIRQRIYNAEIFYIDIKHMAEKLGGRVVTG